MRDYLYSLGLSEGHVRANRTCVGCGESFSITDFLDGSEHYFPKPYDYARGCLTQCLSCWLGNGPEHQELAGNVLRECGYWLQPGCHLVVMPIARATADIPLQFPGPAIIYPAGEADFASLSVVPNDPDSKSLAEHLSAASGVDCTTIARHATIALPIEFDWDTLFKSNHKNQMEFLRSISEAADAACLDVIRYQLCRIEPVDALPGRAGQVEYNHMMAGAVLYNAANQNARIIGGAAFTHFITRGMGLPIESIESDKYPADGEVGHIVKHALSLYTLLLEANTPTSKFIQALALLEFLAEPRGYMKFREVTKIVARYIAGSRHDYDRILERFYQLTGKRDPETHEIVGYRTRIIHIGERLDKLIPDPEERQKLFAELDGYIRPVIDHMTLHSHLSLEEYLHVRGTLEWY